MSNDATDFGNVFKGEGKPVVTQKEKDRGPDLFVTLQPGQSRQLIFVGWLANRDAKLADQPVFYSPLAKRCAALPAHEILLDKFMEVQKMTACIVACTGKPAEGKRGAYRYTVQLFGVVEDSAQLAILSAAEREFRAAVDKLRGGGQNVGNVPF